MSRAAVLLAEGFEEGEALTVADILRRAGMVADLLGTTGETVVGGHDISVVADGVLPDSLLGYDMVILPGGLPGATNLRDDPRVIAAVREMYEHGKWVTAVCAAPMVLGAAGVLDGHEWTAYPGYDEKITTTGTFRDQLVVIDGNVITSRGPASAYAFAYALVDVLGGDSESVKKRMVYRNAFDETRAGN
jgi:4-methyl-5(b-hydroxyethyl)-thiazole monophosphate biosynthesis